MKGRWGFLRNWGNVKVVAAQIQIRKASPNRGHCVPQRTCNRIHVRSSLRKAPQCEDPLYSEHCEINVKVRSNTKL